MFGWLKKKTPPKPEAVPPILQQFLGPMAPAVALAETVSEYVKTVKNGKATSPAYQRQGDSVVGIWSDTRLEALSHLWGYGASDVALLAEHRQQKKLLDAFFEKKPQYEYPHQPSGEPIHDTLQALFQVYLFLDKAGRAVGDKETDSLMSDLELQSTALWAQWNAFEHAVRGSGDRPAMPATLLEVLYNDVTKKAKTIALSARFGPDYQSGMHYLVNFMQKQMKDQGNSEDSINKQVEQVRSTMKKVLAADDPDHLAKQALKRDACFAGAP